jgi:hypothetical protein
MEDIIDIIVTETTNTIEITAQPNDEIIDVNIIDNREDIVLNVTPTVVEININSLTSNFGVEWGDITGTLADQTDLNNALALKANLVGGKVPASELPSYVDDVVEVANFAALPATGETGKIYITLDNNKIYRWSGSVYVEIADSTAVWGAITGTLSSQTDLQSALDAKVAGTGTSGQVAFWNGTSSVTGDTGLVWDNTNKRLGISVASPSAKLEINGSTNATLLRLSTATRDATFSLDTNGYITVGGTLGAFTTLRSFANLFFAGPGVIHNTNTGGGTGMKIIGTGSTTGFLDLQATSGNGNSATHIKFLGGNNGATEIARFLSSGNVLIGATSDNGSRLQVTGTATISSSITANSFIKSGGTSSQFLKADGSVDSSTYLTTGTAASTYVPYTGATGDVNLGVNVLKSNNVILDGDTSATGYLGFKQYSGAQGGGLGYSSISATGLTKFYFRAYQTGADVKSFNFDLASLTNLTERNYTLPDANGTLALTSNLTAYVPYTGATANVDLGTHTLLAAKGTFSSSGSSDTVGITHSSGSGIALNITKGGNGEGIYVNKSSGSGNAVTIVGTLNATTLVRNGGTSSQFLKADGSVDSTAYQAALTNPVTGTGTSNRIAKFNGTSTITDSIIYDNGTRVSIGADVTTTNRLTVSHSTSGSYAISAQASSGAHGIWSVVGATGEIFRGQSSGGAYFFVDNSGNTSVSGQLNVGGFGTTGFKVNIDGTTNITGALSGTSATFSSTLSASSTTLTASANTYAGGALRLNSFTGGTSIYLTSSSGFFALSNGGTADHLLIASTGAATFSSSVTATSIGINTSTINAKLEVASGVPTSTEIQRWSYNNANANFSLRLKQDVSSGLVKHVFDLVNDGTTYANNLVLDRGNVGIGTTAPTFAGGGGLHINQGGTDTRLHLTNSTTGSAATDGFELALVGNDVYYDSKESSGAHLFYTANSPRMAITSGGNVLINGTSNFGGGKLEITYNGQTQTALEIKTTHSDGNNIRFFNSSNTVVGRIYSDASSTSYITSSDYRLKEDLKTIKGLEIVNKIKVYDYKWKSEDIRMDGVLAHELAEVLPYAVTGIKDGEQMQGVDYSKIVPVMVQAIKELKAKIETLENK